jgi:hypothetical protein
LEEVNPYIDVRLVQEARLIQKQMNASENSIPSEEQIRQHYLLEKELAQRILTSPRKNRAKVAIQAYNELFSKIPWHPLLFTSRRPMSMTSGRQTISSFPSWLSAHWAGCASDAAFGLAGARNPRIG